MTAGRAHFFRPPFAGGNLALTAITERSDLARQSKQAVILWTVFFVMAVILNGTIPFVFGADLHDWTQSPIKSVVIAFVFYAVLFLAVPLILIKGWETVRQPAFIYPLSLAMVTITVWHFLPGIVFISIIVLAYLHWHFDLSAYGIRSCGWKGDLLAISFIGLLGFLPLLMKPFAGTFAWGDALGVAMNRWFANPASSVENLFYFGFLTERLSFRTGPWLTPPLIGLMYTAHEMTNPEYWYGNMNFVLIYVGVTIWSAVYLWRRGVIAIWLGDGLYRFAGKLF
jgi:hypothetical protein